ncbi:MAG TPA: hypothetical protein DCL43_04715 [Chitinophagaceae bacterium]|nr:hypothetical protein [Chitinophagaceae bacterium]HAN38521.1 hypothetical protein [Chitinophagaceae bacterium]
MGFWQQIGEYLYLRKKDPNAGKGTWIKHMHGMNRISLYMFLFCLLVILFRFVIKPLLMK